MIFDRGSLFFFNLIVYTISQYTPTFQYILITITCQFILYWEDINYSIRKQQEC